MAEYLTLLQGWGIAEYAWTAGIIGFLVLLVIGVKLVKRDSNNPVPPTPSINKNNRDEVPGEPILRNISVLGTGKYRAYALAGNMLFPTTIPEPVGNILVADTSMPVCGACYLVIGDDDNNIKAYDPLSEPLLAVGTPQKAFFATHWPIVEDVYGVPSLWWQDVNAWLAAGVLVIDFIAILAYLGG